MTRGMAVTVLQKLAPDTTPTAAATFSDVLEEDWFAAGVSWAAASGVAGGYPDGRFRPNQVLTRQEAAVMLHAFAHYMGCSFYCFSLPPQITDAAQVESWAHSAVSWAYQRNLLVLREGSTLAPNEPITRAEMAHALTVLCKNILF